MPLMKHGEFIRKHPVFSGYELAEHLSSQGEVGNRAKEALLAYYQKTGRIVRVRRGLYAVIPAEADLD
jgi:predicted transcriptional regulator of viral defense system